MTELPDGSKTSFNVPAAIDAADLLRYYSFDLGGYPVEQLLGHWLTQYSAEWIRLAVIEALYQGRYKAISVEQILVLWQRRQQAFCHFNREFERLVCNKIPHQLNLTSRSPVSSQPKPSESTLPTYLSHRRVVLHLPHTQQAISLLQTPAKIPPLRITPATNGSSASRLLNLVSPTQTTSQPLPPFPVDHIDQPVGESARTPCPPVAELRTVVSQPSLELPRLTSEPSSTQPTPEVDQPEPVSSIPPEVTPRVSKTPCSSAPSADSPPKLPQAQALSGTNALNRPAPLPKLAEPTSPIVQSPSDRSPTPPALSSQSHASPSEVTPAEAPSAPPTEIKAKRGVELPIWKRIQSDPMLANQLTIPTAPATQTEPDSTQVTYPALMATDPCQELDSKSFAATRNGQEQVLEQIRQGIQFFLDLGLTNPSMHPKLRLLLSQLCQFNWAIFDFNQPIHQFVPAIDSPDFHGKLRAVAQSSDTKPTPVDVREASTPSAIEQKPV